MGFARPDEPVAHRFAFLAESGPLAFAHRGGATHPDNLDMENSRLAFKTAVDMGYRYLETDVHLTRDGVLVAFHDAKLDRCTTGAGRIRDLPYAEVRRALIDGREPVPALAELLAAWPDVRWNIDLKSARAIGPLVEVVRQADAFDRVCVASFSQRRIRRARALLGTDVATAMGPLEVAVLWLVPWRRARALLLSSGVPCVQVPRSLGSVTLVDAGFVRRAHDHGCQVHVWTVDDARSMNELLDLGVDGIMSDRIDILRNVLRARGQWKANSR
jgi:glycerophosphoryl diester phosphodiesterase